MTIREELQGSGRLYPKPDRGNPAALQVEYHLEVYKVLVYDDSLERTTLEIAEICGQLVPRNLSQIQPYVGATSRLHLADGRSLDLVVKDAGGDVTEPTTRHCRANGKAQ